MAKKITADLDRLIKRAAEIKTAGVSEKLDAADGGTSPATTGEQAAKNKADAGEITAAAVDGGAKTNPVGASVENSTAGATASSADGNAGAKGAEMAIKKDADNGEEKEQNKIAAIRAEAEKLHKAAAALLTPLDHFLVKAARASEDKQVKTAADAMSEDDLADVASDQIMEQLAAGQIDDAAAAQILEEALAAGALTEDEVAEAAALAQQAGGAPAEGAPAEAAAAAPAEAAPAAPVEDPMMKAAQAKLAAAEIGPEHPQYLQKLDAQYDAEQKAGREFFRKVAAAIMKNAEEAPKEEEKENPAEEAAEKHEEAETPAQEAKEEAGAQVIDSMAGANLAPSDADEKAALEAVKAELGLDDAQLAQLAAAPVPAMDKVASAKAKYRAAIMAKVAALKK